MTAPPKSPSSTKAQALRLLAMREHSRLELTRKLQRKALSTDAAGGEVEAVLDQLAENGLQSDHRFAESFIRARSARQGVTRIRRELADRGVAADIIATALAEGLCDDTQSELQRARVVWQKKFGQVAGEAKEWARQARFLQSRGFAPDIIRQLLKDPLHDFVEG